MNLKFTIGHHMYSYTLYSDVAIFGIRMIAMASHNAHKCGHSPLNQKGKKEEEKFAT